MPDGRRPQQREWQGSKRRAPGSLSLAADCILREVNVCVCVCGWVSGGQDVEDFLLPKAFREGSSPLRVGVRVEKVWGPAVQK